MNDMPRLVIVRNEGVLVATLKEGDTFFYEGPLLPLKVLDGRTFQQIVRIAQSLDNGHYIKRSIKDDVSYELVD